MAQLQIQTPAAIPPVVNVVPAPVPVSIVPQPVGSQSSLYVGDLDPAVTEGDLFEVFSRIGQVLSIRVCRDNDSRRSLGYAYVNYSTPYEAGRALEHLNFTPVHNKPMRIMFSHRDPSIRKSGTGNIYVKYLPKNKTHKDLYDAFAPFGKISSCKVELDIAGNSKGFGYVQYESQESAKEAIEKMNDTHVWDSPNKIYVCEFRKRNERQAPTGFTNVYVKNLPENVTMDDLKAKFEVYGTINSAVVMKNEDGKSKGFGFVCFNKPEDAAAAVEALNGKTYDEETSKAMFVGKAQKKAEREAELRSRLHQNKDKFQGVNLYLKNLEDVVDDAKLKEIFQEFGTVVSCKVMRDTTGHSKGSGFVAFETPEEADRARIAMHNQMVGSKPIYVAPALKRDDRRQYNADQAQFGAYRLPLFTNGGHNLPAMFQTIPQPIYYGQHAAFPPQQHTGYGFQQQQVIARPNGMPTGGYFMPHIVSNRQQQQQPQPQPQQRPGGRRTQQQTAIAPQQRVGTRNLRYTPTVRNETSPPPAEQQSMSITALLAKAPSHEGQIAVLGEHLFPQVEMLVAPEQAGKVTGMLLEMDQTEILHLIDTPDALKSKVGEALEVLSKSKIEA